MKRFEKILRPIMKHLAKYTETVFGNSQRVFDLNLRLLSRLLNRFKAYICKRGWKKLLLVTCPTHSRRASATFEREGLIVISSPSVQIRFDLERLEQPDNKIRAFPALVHERLGLWLYARRGWIEEY